MVASSLRECVTHPDASGSADLADLEKLFRPRLTISKGSPQ